MKYLAFLFGVFLPVHALASPPIPTIPQNQYLEALYYSRAGQQTGCGLRITGETKDNLWINVLVSVSMKESGALFGIFKLAVKKIIMRNGEPLIQDGKVMYSSIGNIHKGWIKTDSGVQLLATKDAEYFHNDGYMASMEFYKAMELLIAIPQTNFRVGFSKKENVSEEVFEFNQRITQDEADRLSSCMKSLRDAKNVKIL